MKAELRDVALVPMSLGTENLVLKIDPTQFKIRPCALDLIECNIILGKLWLSKINLIFDKENKD